MPHITPSSSVNNGLHRLVCELDAVDSLLKGGLTEHHKGISEVSGISAAAILPESLLQICTSTYRSGTVGVVIVPSLMYTKCPSMPPKE